MARSLTLDNIQDKKHKTFDFDGVWRDVLGELEVAGLMLIYGMEKNGKTWLALLLAEMLSYHGKVLYVSAEEGVKNSFKQSTIRAKLRRGNRNLHFCSYLDVAEIGAILEKRRGPMVVLLDNATIYEDELKYGGMRRMFVRHCDSKRIILLSHEKNREPFPAPAQVARRLADVIVRVEGLACHISGRCPGGTLAIDEHKAKLFHGNDITVL